MIYSPNTVIAATEPTEPAAAGTATDAAPVAVNTSTGTTQVPLDVKALMDAINADREQREKRAQAETDNNTFKSKYEEVASKLAEIERAKKNRLLDPAGYLRKLGYSDRDLALTSEGIMFSLMPDKAPPAHVANLIKAQREQDMADQEEREKQREVEAHKRATDAHVTSEKEIEARYLGSLTSQVTAMKPGTFPASQEWYAGDHTGYAQELFDTARNLAEAAMKTGQTVDVSAAAIAQHVEKKYAERGQRLARIFGATPSPTTTQKQPQVSVPATAEPAEIKPSGNHGLSEKEIIERATKAAFGIR